VVIPGFARYRGAVRDEHAPAIQETFGHERDDTPPAPGELELVRAFMSLHDHARGVDDSLPPSSRTIASWMRSEGLIDDEPVPERDLAWTAEVLEALRALVPDTPDGPADGAARVLETADGPADEAARVLDGAVARTALVPRFTADDEPLTPAGTGIQYAVGRILAVAFLAKLDGRWSRFRTCSEPTCRAVFWDRSKNRSGRWCSMSTCGNRAKVRAYRKRHATR
jgi:hypothetical protein